MLGLEYIGIAFAILVLSDIVSPSEDVTTKTYESDK
jgi:hypothetical protein